MKSRSTREYVRRIGYAFSLAMLLHAAQANAQSSKPTTGNVIISNGANCTTIVPTTDETGDILTGASTTSSPCLANNGEYVFQTFPSGQIPKVVTYIPHVVDGGVWKTTIVIANLTASAATASLTCYQEIAGGSGVAGGSGATQLWNVPFLENVNVQSIALTAGGTIFLDTPGTNATLSQGWCAVSASDGVQSHAVFSLGLNNSQGTAPAVITWSDILIPVDNTNGSLTAIAVANPTANSQIVSVSFQNNTATAPISLTGANLPGTFTLPANGHTALLLSNLLPQSAGQRGLAEVIVSGTVSLIALQFNPTLNFTTAPAYPISNGPVIGARDPVTCLENPSQTGCPDPAIFLLTLSANFTIASGSAFPVVISITPGPTGYSAAVSGTVNGQTVNGSFIGGTLTGSGNQLVWAFQTPNQGSSFLGGSLNFTMTQTDFDGKIGEGVGTATGQLVLTQPLVGGGTINGIFTEITPIWAFLWLVDIQ